MNADNKLLVLVDGSSYLYRAYHALPPLTSSKGQPTGAIYGVLSMLRKLINDYQPHHIAVVFDSKGKTFRDELFAEYKSHRPPMPDELKAQIEPLFAVIKAMHLPLLVMEGVEADDVIGTLAREAEKIGMRTVISTGDKDIAQLVNQHITLVNTMTNTTLDRKGVEDKFGVPPERIIDYLTLVGDKSDNIPGVPGVGPKTAEKWLKEWGSLDEIICHADKIAGKVGENLRAHLSNIPLAKQLVTIKCDVILPYKISDLEPGKPDQAQLIELYRELELKTWLAEALKNIEPETHQVKAEKKYHAITSQEKWREFLSLLSQQEIFAFDTETTSLNYMEAQLVGLSFSWQKDEAYYIPVGHTYLGVPEQLPLQQVLAELKPIFENDVKKKIGHNIKYDVEVLANYHIDVKGIAFDTMLESYVLDSTATRHDMDTLSLKYLGHKTITYDEVTGTGAKRINFSEVDLQVATQYAAEDADVTWQLHQVLWPKIHADEKLKYVFQQIEVPLIHVLVMMERNGVLLDVAQLKQQSELMAKTIKQLEDKIYQLSGVVFNIGSPKQLQEILFEKLKLPVSKKTPTGQISTAESVLQELAEEYELPKIILEYRSLAKLKSTYTDRLPEQVNSVTHRVHTSYNQTGAGTGRLSSSDPNLQNIPIRTEEGRKIRKAFIARPGYKIVAADYSQIELRIMAHLSQDKGLVSAFNHGQDIHRATAAQVFGQNISEVTDDQRRKAKAINFGLIYGMSAFGLAKQLRIERAAAQSYIDSYFMQYPGVLNYMQNTREKAHQQGYVETILGRRLYLSEINARNLQLQKAAERAAINAPMQGTAADIIKLAMNKIATWLDESDVDAKLIMQVHDELVFEVADMDIDVAKEKIVYLMENAVHLAVPLEVDVGVGNNWDEAH